MCKCEKILQYIYKAWFGVVYMLPRACVEYSLLADFRPSS